MRCVDSVVSIHNKQESLMLIGPYVKLDPLPAEAREVVAAG